MKKVGIVTVLGGHNFGNKLQMYAVSEIIRDLGYEPVVLRKRSKASVLSNKRRTFNVGKLKSLSWMRFTHSITNRLNYKFDIKDASMLRCIMRATFYRKRINKARTERAKRFNTFDERHIALSDFLISEDCIPADIDDFHAFVCGSDQVWNPTYNYTSSIEFLAFAPEEKRIALSPSFGVDTIPESKRSHFKAFIAGIPYLSVRESRGAQIIKELTGRDSMVLCDPTMALPIERWIKLERKPVWLEEERYVLAYFLGNSTRDYERFISKHAKELNAKIIHLADARQLKSYDADPCEFIYLFRHSQYVCTDSFHGAVFSILFDIPFTVFERAEHGQSMGSRLDTLTNKFKLNGNWYKMGSKRLRAPKNSAQIKAFERDALISYLKKALEEIQ